MPNLTVAVDERADEVVFLHRIVDGAATKSYGLHVASWLAPSTVLQRADSVLAALKAGGDGQGPLAVAPHRQWQTLSAQHFRYQPHRPPCRN